MTILIWLGIAAAISIGSFTAGWSVNDWRVEAQRKASIEAAYKERDDAQARANEIALRFETKLSKLRIVNRTINNEVRHETEKLVYRDCLVPAGGVLLVNRSVSETNSAASYIPSGLPTSATSTRKRVDGGSLGP